MFSSCSFFFPFPVFLSFFFRSYTQPRIRLRVDFYQPFCVLLHFLMRWGSKHKMVLFGLKTKQNKRVLGPSNETVFGFFCVGRRVVMLLSGWLASYSGSVGGACINYSFLLF